jgi:hypothetical protein
MTPAYVGGDYGRLATQRRGRKRASAPFQMCCTGRSIRASISKSTIAALDTLNLAPEANVSLYNPAKSD